MGHRVGQEVMINDTVIRLLLRHNARLDIVDKFGKTPVNYAKNVHVIDLLLNHFEGEKY